MKTNNRPMVKVVEYEWEAGTNRFIWKSEPIPIELEMTGLYKQTGKTREVERQMNDTEYIEYLEEQVSDTFAKLVSVEELSKQTIFTLEKENQELKEQIEKAIEEQNENK